MAKMPIDRFVYSQLMPDPSSLEFRFLGPFEVRADGAILELGPYKQKALLTLLALDAGRVVSTDRLLDSLWDDDGADHDKALWVYISRLRSALEPNREGHGESALLLTRPPGYVLAVDPTQIDITRFEEKVALARSLVEQPNVALSELNDALGMWRGDALAEFTYEDFARPWIDRLNELRLDAFELKFDAALTLGQARQLVSDLESLTGAHPYREGLVGLLMTALYRSGRQSEALRAYEHHRRVIGEELGIEPSPELRQLEERMLLHDPTLALQPASVELPAEFTNPYKGLRAFDADDADRFHGRTSLVAEILRHLERRDGLVSVVGPSGSGKSSVVMAGVVAALRKGVFDGADQWQIATMVPGAHPFTELEIGLLRSTIDPPNDLGQQLSKQPDGILNAALRVSGSGGHLLLVIDQFEEIFTLVSDPEVRGRFLTGLVTAANDPESRLTVLLTLRSDFYDEPLQHAEFGALLGASQVNVTPLTADELTEAAIEPAAELGIDIEPSLLGQLVVDVVNQPGALPMFQYTLTELVERRQGQTLELAQYQAMGGVRGAIANRANELYNALAPEEREAARQLLLRLVTVTADGSLSRRRVRASEITSLEVDVVALQSVIDQFGRARLVSFDRDRATGSPTLEVAHEALLTEWGRLSDWISDARNDLLQHASLTRGAEEWERFGRDDDFLPRGAQLAQFERLAATGTLQLNAPELAYLGSAMERRSEELAVEERRIEAESQLQRRSRARLWSLLALLLIVSAAGVFWVVATRGSEPPTVGLVGFFDRGSATYDHELIYSGFDQATLSHGFETVEVALPFTEVDTAFRSVVADGAQLVIFDSFVAFDPALAEEFPETTFVRIDAVGPSQGLNNLVEVKFAKHEAAFLAGAAAALTSETGRVGYLGGAQFSEIVNLYQAGFIAGARHVNPDIDVMSTFLGADTNVWESPTAAKAVAEDLFARDVDVLMQAVGGSEQGVFDAAQQQTDSTGIKRWIIGTDGDAYLYVPEEQRSLVLASAFGKVDAAVIEVIDRFLAGELEGGAVTLGLHEDGVALGGTGGGIQPHARQLAEIATAIAEGTIEVPVAASDQPLPPADFDLSDASGSISIDSNGVCSHSYDGPTPYLGLDVVYQVENRSNELFEVNGSAFVAWAGPLQGSFPGDGADIPLASIIVNPGDSMPLYLRYSEPADLEIRCTPDPLGPAPAYQTAATLSLSRGTVVSS